MKKESSNIRPSSHNLSGLMALSIDAEESKAAQTARNGSSRTPGGQAGEDSGLSYESKVAGLHFPSQADLSREITELGSTKVPNENGIISKFTVTPGVVKLSQHLPDGTVDKSTIGRPLRREIFEWSRRSRARMVEVLASLDYLPLFAQGTPAMVTFTYPGFWELVAPDGATVKRHFKIFGRRFERKYGRKFIFLAKLEFQRRGAPHIHSFFVPPHEAVFKRWVSETWADIVAHPCGIHRRAHISAGTAVDYFPGILGRDPKKIASYFSKHAAAGGQGSKEYQHVVPELWRGRKVGRFWWYAGLEIASAEVKISDDDYIFLRRILRQLSRRIALPSLPGSNYPARVLVAHDGKVRRCRSVDFPNKHPDSLSTCGHGLYSMRVPRISQGFTEKRVLAVDESGVVFDSILDLIPGGFITTGDGQRLARDLIRALKARREETFDPYSVSVVDRLDFFRAFGEKLNSARWRQASEGVNEI